MIQRALVFTFAMSIAGMGSSAYAGAGACTICSNCPSGVNACFPGGTSTTVCDSLGCTSANDTSTECFDSAMCPQSEADGSCTDGVNNDAWQNGLTDCADPSCSGDPACSAAAVPAVSEWGLAVMVLVLLVGGTIAVGRNRQTAANA
ncbi:MAG: hypothetical protein ACPGXK_08645 [Phycisphaerae bacterium]